MAVTLASIMIDVMGNDSQFNATLDRAVSRGMASGARAGASFGSSFGIGFSNPILNAVSGINSAIGGMQTIGAMALDVSGMRTAATFGAMRRTLSMIAGDANVAEKAMRGFVDIAGKSNFDTDQIAEIGVSYAGRTGDVAGAVAATQNMVDAAAATGVKPADFMEWRKNLSDIAVKGDRKVDRPDFEQLNRRAELTRFQIGKLLGLDPGATEKRMRSMSGRELSELIRKIGDANAGLAASRSGDNPLDVGRNIVDSLKSGMASTGGLLNAVLTPAATGIKNLVDGLGEINSAGKGIPGLITIIGGGVLAMRYFGGTVSSVTATIRGVIPSVGNFSGSTVRATTALDLFTAALGRATSRLGTPGGGGGAGGGGTTALVPLGGPNGGSTALVRTGAGAAAATGVVVSRFARFAAFMGRIGLLLKSATGLGIIATIGSMGLSYLGSAIGGGKNASVQQRGMAAILGGAGTGMGIGALVGILGGPAGILAGAGIGALVGGIGGAIMEKVKMNREAAEKANPEAEKTKALKENTEAIKTSTKMSGGGRMAATSLSIVEREWAVYNLMRGAQTGVG